MSILWWIIAAIVIGGVICVTIYGTITRSKIREHLDNEERERKKTLYGLITDIQPNTVTIDMVDSWGNKEGEVKYESSDGVSYYIREGDRI